MASMNGTYIDRDGEKLPLTKSANEFVVQASPERLETLGITETEETSLSASKVTTTEGEMDAMMALAENVSVTQLAYYEADDSQPVQGAWRLQVADLEAKDASKLNRWGLKIKRDA